MQHKIERLTGKDGATVEAARGGQVEYGWRAAHLNDQRMKGAGIGCFLGNPECVFWPGGFSDDKLVWRDAETFRQTRRIGASGFAHHLGRGDPQKRSLRTAREPGQSQRKTGRGCAVAHGIGMQFHEARKRQTAAKRCIETLDAGLCCRLVQACRDLGRQGGVIDPVPLAILRACLKPFGEAAFNSGDLLAQGNKRLPRHGVGGHDDQSSG